jgi:hypothetical protein
MLKFPLKYVQNGPSFTPQNIITWVEMFIPGDAFAGVNMPDVPYVVCLLVHSAMCNKVLLSSQIAL